MWVARRLHWTAYLRKLQIENPAICNLSLVLEPLSKEQMSYVNSVEHLQIQFPALDAGALPIYDISSDSRNGFFAEFR